MKEKKHLLHAKKSLGQNFLKSKKAIHQMISAVAISADDIVVEIGPGKGALTKPLLETGARVIAFELDDRMIDFLKDEFFEYYNSGQLQIIHKDVLEIDMQSFFGSISEYKVVANIPYYITNAIIRKFLDTDYQPTEMSLLMQREVAERIVCRDTKQSLLSLSVAVFGDAHYVGKVDRKYFSPSPKVHSAILHINNISQERITNNKHQKTFFDLIHVGFAHKRKQLIKNLEILAPKDFWKKVFLELGLIETARAEEVDLVTWISLVEHYEQFLSDKK